MESKGEESKASGMKVSDIETFDFDNRQLYRQKYGDKVVDAAQKKTNEVTKALKDTPVLKNASLSTFSNEKEYQGQWTNTTLDLLEVWKNSCKTSAEKYAQAARNARVKHRMISIPAVILATAATAVSFFSAGDTCDPDNEDGDNLKYAVAVLTSAVSVIGGVSALYNFSSKMTQCISASGNFANLARRAEIQIYLPNSLRSHSELVLTDISIEYANLTTNSPLL